jgi:hypothetical protein
MNSRANRSRDLKWQPGIQGREDLIPIPLVSKSIGLSLECTGNLASRFDLWGFKHSYGVFPGFPAPWTKVVKHPRNTGVALTTMSLCISQIGKVEELQKVDHPKITETNVLPPSLGEGELDDLSDAVWVHGGDGTG